MDLLIQVLKLVTAVAGLAATVIRFIPKAPSNARNKDDRQR